MRHFFFALGGDGILFLLLRSLPPAYIALRVGVRAERKGVPFQ
jgi:hypothetical protein